LYPTTEKVSQMYSTPQTRYTTKIYTGSIGCNISRYLVDILAIVDKMEHHVKNTELVGSSQNRMKV